MKRALAGLTRWLLRAAAAIGPGEKSEWIDAVLAEGESIEGPWEALQWAWGAVFFACRCRILVALGIVQENIVMNKASAAYVVIFLVMVGVLSAIPSFREAATDALGPSTIRLAFGPRKGPLDGMSDGELRRMAAKAEQRGDASAAAFAAMRLEDAQQGMQLGKRAIAMKPSLAWIEYFILMNNFLSRSPHTTFEPEIHEVIAGDPDNALGYLLLARSVRLTDDKLTTRRAEWEAAMEKAFSAVNYDDYLNRRLELDREVVRARKITPVEADLAMSLWLFLVPSDVYTYSDQLIASGDTQACARVARFGAMLENAQSDLEWSIGQSIRKRALDALEKKLGLKFMAPETLPSPNRPYDDRRGLMPFAEADGIVVQASFVIASLVGLLVAGCAVVLLLRRRKSTMLERLLRVAAITGAAAVLTAFLAFLPFASAYRSYLHAKTAHEALAGLFSFDGFYILPRIIDSFLTTAQGHVHLWSLVILTGAAVMVWLVVVHVQRARMRPA